MAAQGFRLFVGGCWVGEFFGGVVCKQMERNAGWQEFLEHNKEEATSRLQKARWHLNHA
jgi:hypothetical protein